jgi:hypothetical protein
VLVASAFSRAKLLVPAALAFAIPVAIVAAAHADLRGGMGERTFRPRSLAEMRPSYRLGVGRLEVDLRAVAFPPGVTSLRVRLGAGQLVVLVPDTVCVSTRAQLGGGYVGALDRESEGLDVDWSNRPSPPARVPRLLVEGDVGLGAMFVADRPLGRVWNEGSGTFRAGAFGDNAACGGRAEVAR